MVFLGLKAKIVSISKSHNQIFQWSPKKAVCFGSSSATVSSLYSATECGHVRRGAERNRASNASCPHSSAEHSNQCLQRSHKFFLDNFFEICWFLCWSCWLLEQVLSFQNFQNKKKFKISKKNWKKSLEKKP